MSTCCGRKGEGAQISLPTRAKAPSPQAPNPDLEPGASAPGVRPPQQLPESQPQPQRQQQLRGSNSWLAEARRGEGWFRGRTTPACAWWPCTPGAHLTQCLGAGEERRPWVLEVRVACARLAQALVLEFTSFWVTSFHNLKKIQAFGGVGEEREGFSGWGGVGV